MLVTLLGMETEINCSQSLNAKAPSEATPSLITTCLILLLY